VSKYNLLHQIVL